MRRLIVLRFLILNIFIALQFLGNVGVNSLQAQELYPQLKSFITPSPQATSFTRYGDYPVNYNTGLVDMSIPIYTVQSGSLNLPIGISFHASGRMANEIKGILGMRWVLNGGGVITRTVRGYPDEWSDLSQYPHTINSLHNPNFDELFSACSQGFNNDYYMVNDTQYDTEFDVFRYQLPSGKSGKFILKNDNGVKKAVTIPFEALDIELITDSFYSLIRITDVDGTIYNYGSEDISSSNHLEFNFDSDNTAMPSNVPTGWYLKSIESADKQDTIQLNYQRMLVKNYNYTEGVIVADRPRDYDFYGQAEGWSLFDYVGEIPREEYNDTGLDNLDVPILSSIIFKHGVLDLTYEVESVYSMRLKEMELSGAVKGKFKFDQVKSPNEKDIFYLKGVEFFSVLNSVETLEKKYSFDYYEPLPNLFNSYLYQAIEKKDWWGYFNYHSDVAAALFYYPNEAFERYNQGYSYYNLGSSNVTRDPDLESMKFGMLKTITYPTGGKTIFEYEHNYYKEGTIKTKGPGLRISKIINDPILGDDLIRIFKYGQNEDGIGYINTTLKPGEHTIQESSMMAYWDHSQSGGTRQLGYRSTNYSSDPLINPGDFGGNATWYDLVTEYQQENTALSWKTVYEYSPKIFDTELYFVDDREYGSNYNSLNPKVFSNPFRLWEGGKLKYKTIYKKEGSSLIPITKETYVYQSAMFDEAWDMPTFRYVNFSFNINYYYPYSNAFDWQYDTEKDYHNNICSVIGYGLRKYISGSENLKTKTVEYYDGEEIAISYESFYDPQYNQLIKEEFINSNENKITTEYEYPFNNILDPVSNKMVNLNMISKPLSTSQYIDDEFMQKNRTLYYEWFTDVISPISEYFKKANSDEEPIVVFQGYYDSGKVKEVSRMDGTPVVYIWGYKGQYPIAKIENATFLQVTSAISGLSPSYNTLSELHELADMDDSHCTDQVSCSEKNLRLALNDLRESLPTSMVTTNTYDPLIGVTSQTDPSGYTSYYVYDAFNRLKFIRDENNNILKEYDYHYKGE